MMFKKGKLEKLMIKVYKSNRLKEISFQKTFCIGLESGIKNLENVDLDTYINEYSNFMTQMSRLGDGEISFKEMELSISPDFKKYLIYSFKKLLTQNQM